MCEDCDKTNKTIFTHLGLSAIALAKHYGAPMMVVLRDQEIALTLSNTTMAAFIQASGKGFIVCATTSDEALMTTVSRLVVRIAKTREIRAAQEVVPSESHDDIESALLAFTDKNRSSN